MCSDVPREDLVVAILKVSLLLFPHRIYQLVLMEVEDLVQRCKVWSESY